VGARNKDHLRDGANTAAGLLGFSNLVLGVFGGQGRICVKGGCRLAFGWRFGPPLSGQWTCSKESTLWVQNGGPAVSCGVMGLGVFPGYRSTSYRSAERIRGSVGGLAGAMAMAWISGIHRVFPGGSLVLVELSVAVSTGKNLGLAPRHGPD